MSYDEEFMRRARYIAERVGMNLTEVLEKVREYIEEMGGLIKPDGALSLLASDLGVSELLPERSPKPTIRLDRLVPGMRRATIRGKVTKFYGVIDYVNKSGERSQRAELRISDEYSQVDLVVWSQRLIEMLKEGLIREGDEVLISNVRVSSRGGKLIVHLDSDSQIELLERGAPPSDETITRVSEVYEREGEEVDFRGTVVRVFPVSEFAREDGRKGKRSSIIVQGEDGSTIRVLLWGDKASLSESIGPGDSVTLRNFRVVAREEGIELHSTARSRVEAVGGKIETITTVVLYKFPKEESVLGKSFSDILIEVDGELEVARVWGELADVIEGIEPPFIMRMGPTFRRYDDLLSLSKSGTLEVLDVIDRKLDESIGELARSVKYKRVPIGESSDGFREFRGTVVGVSDEARITWHCPTCGSRVSYEYGSYSCPNCGTIEKALPLLYLTFTLDDGTGVARVVAFGRKAEKILGMSTDEVVLRADELGQPHHAIPTEELSAKILGREVIVRGRATYTETGLVKLILDEMELVDYAKETSLLIREVMDRWLGDEELEGYNG
ncbi:MAG: hypothetical protein NZ992_06555 [Candidatus Korarchaeum sp.]|nr:hypothetical protein [Candidatus Korarchaeum sp.]MDW8036026.1 hypothetical protein [Candidatus Korarchaeum sp.]